MPELDRAASHQLDGPAALSAAGIGYVIGSGRHRGYVVANCPCCGNTTLRVPKRRARGLVASCEDGCATADIAREISALTQQLREPSWFPAAGPLRARRLRGCIEREIAPRLQIAVERELALQADQRASLEQDPDWRRKCDELRAHGISDDGWWHSEDEIYYHCRFSELERLFAAGRELHRTQLAEILKVRQHLAKGRRRVADAGWWGDDDGLTNEIATRAERDYAVVLQAWRVHVRPTAHRRSTARGRGGRPRSRRRRQRARAPADDGPGSSEPPGVAGRRDPLDPPPVSAIAPGAAC